MGFAGVIVALVFYVLHAIGMVRLWPLLGLSRELETFLVVAGLVLSLISLLGILFNKRWGWPLVLLMFSLGLAATVLLYAQLGASLTLALLMAVTVFAMLVSFIAVDLWEPDFVATEPVQTWDAQSTEPADSQVSSVTTTVGDAPKKKSARKKSSRKKSSRKKSSRKKSRR